MPRILDRYVLRELAPPFLIGLLLVTFVLLMNQVLLLADLFIAKGVPAPEAVRILGLLLPSVLVFAAPMAVLMGVLGGLGRLSADSEIVALQSLGVGPRRLLRPVLFFGFCGFLLTLPLALIVAPRANHAWVKAMTGSVLGRVRLDVTPLEFNEALPNTVFFVQDVDRAGVWHNVFAYLNDDPALPRLAMARAGRIVLLPETRRAVLELSDGVLYSGPPAEPEKDSVTSFDRLEEEIDVGGLFPSVSSVKRVREKDIGELLRDAGALGTDARDRREVRAHWIEVHKKFALPFACLVFALLGLPLGVMTGRAGRTGGFSLGLGIILLYYALLTLGESAAMDGRIGAFLGMWGPDIVLAVAALLLLLGAGGRVARPGGRPGRSKAGRPAGGPAAGPSRRALGPRLRLPSVRFPNILDRYVSRKFLAVFGLVFSALAVATALVLFFDRLGDVLRTGRPVGLLVRYVALKLPESAAFILPVSVLATTLLVLGLLARTNEATAMKAVGVSVVRTLAPVLVLAAVASLLAFLVQERVVPAAHARAEETWGRQAGLPARSYSFVNRHWVLGRSKDRIYHYDYFEPGSSTFGRLGVFDIDPGRWTLRRRFFAGQAVLEDAGFAYRDAWARDFAGAEGRPFVRLESGRLEPGEEKSAFLGVRKEPLQMTLGELRRYTAEVRGMGFGAVRLRAAVAEKSALPFVSLVMALLAVPFGFAMGKKGTLVGVGLSVVLAMVYWGVFALFRSLGGAGVLTPSLGAWAANVIFGLAGAVGMLKIRT
jgi:LPS export ABC transporter permease LptF/LPS export ABC transporter permease LptG